MYFTADDDIRPGRGGSRPSNLTNVSGVAFFTADPDGAVGRELWKSLGEATSTSMVVRVLESFATLRQLTGVGETLFFDLVGGIEEL